MAITQYAFLNSFLDIIEKYKIEYWLEGGTALAAYRDGKILSWEHDFDIGVWKNDIISKILDLKYEFQKINCKVVIQKNFPFIDNLVQIYSLDKSNNPNQIDIYLYTKKNNNAYMRWFHKPEGFYGYFLKAIFFLNNKNLKKVYNKNNKNLIDLFSIFFYKMIFVLIFNFHFHLLKCRYHYFPGSFFNKKKLIFFCGRNMTIPYHIEDFLTFRYGNNWKIPDDTFNQTGKWKKSIARPVIKLNFLPKIKIDYHLYKND